MGGGTGGHSYPLLPIARSLKEKAVAAGKSLELLIIGDGAFIEEIATAEGIAFKRVLSGKYRRYKSILNFLDILKIPIGLIQALWHVFWFMPDVVFSKGGAASFLPVLASRLYFIPVFLHDSDSVPGLANRKLAKRARKIFISYQKTAQFYPEGKTILVGNPIRKELFGRDKVEALNYFKLSPSKQTLFILGGSQGAQVINNEILAALVRMTEKYNVIHQCGDANFKALQIDVARIVKEGEGTYGQIISDSYRLYPFLSEDEMAFAYAAADLIISRAGGSIFEIAAAGKPAILIPLSSSADNHQMENAMEFSQYGAVVIEEEHNLTESILLGDVERVLRPETYSATVEKIKSFAKPNAADEIAQTLLNL